MEEKWNEMDQLVLQRVIFSKNGSFLPLLLTFFRIKENLLSKISSHLLLAQNHHYVLSVMLALSAYV